MGEGVDQADIQLLLALMAPHGEPITAFLLQLPGYIIWVKVRQ